MEQRKYDVYLYEGVGKETLVDTVYFTYNMSAKEVRTSLIEHDCYSPKISVYRYAKDQYAYDDAARASHPEEC